MPSRLSSLLVSDGVVSVKRMEHAFQRQVIYGGSLDTILLEMSIVPEERLLQYLSKSTGLPPATREEVDVADPGAVARCPVEVAKIYRVVPLCFADGALRILVQDPVEMAVLEELANELEVPVQPLVAPEYRFHLVFTRVYGGTPDARFETLARRAEESRPSQPVGKARTIIVDTTVGSSSLTVPSSDINIEQSSGNVMSAPGVTAARATVRPTTAAERDAEQRPPEPPPRRREKRTMQMATAALAQRAADDRTERAPTEPGFGPGRYPWPGEDAEQVFDDTPSGPHASPSAATGATPGHQSTAPIAAADDEPTWRDVAPLVPAGAPISRATRARVQAAVDTAPAPLVTSLSPAAAMEALPRAEGRDLIFNLLLRAIRHHVRYAALFTVQERSAIGRIAIDDDVIDHAAIAQVVVALDVASPFRTVVSSVAPYFGALATGAPDIDGALAGLDVRLAASALLLPIVLRGRVVAIAMGHGRDQTLDASALAALLPVASRAAEALSRLIVKSKAERRGQHEVEVPAGMDNGPSGPVRAATSTLGTQSTQPIAGVLVAVQSDDAEVARAARDGALARPAETTAALAAEFPGALILERYELEGRAATAAEHGPLLALTVALGAAAGDLLVEKMRDQDRDVRYYATLCAGESRPRGAVDSLVDRLFDNDYGIRSIAIDALSGYPAPAREQALQRVRQALHDETPVRVQAAANALAKLGDAAAVPVLIDVLDAGTEAAEPARRALIVLTMEDCGTNARKWRAWWASHQGEHRIEWLIAALGHKDENLRSAAAVELRQTTGEYFDFHHDLPRKEREQAQQRWRDWWEQSGRRQFTAGQS